MTGIALRAEILPSFDYDALLPEHATLAREAVAFIEGRQRGMAAAVIEIGQKLNAVKAALEHGQFMAWLAASFTMHVRTAQNYMQAATALESKSETVSYLPVATVYEIARAPEPIREKVIGELEAAPKPLPAKAVSNLIWEAQQEAKRAAEDAKLTPAGRKRAKEERQKAKAAHLAFMAQRAREEAVDERATVRLAELLLACVGDEKDEIVSLLRQTNIQGGQLAYRLTGGLYGRELRAYREHARTYDEWTELVAQLERGENPVR